MFGSFSACFIIPARQKSCSCFAVNLFTHRAAGVGGGGWGRGAKTLLGEMKGEMNPVGCHVVKFYKHAAAS